MNSRLFAAIFADKHLMRGDSHPAIAAPTLLGSIGTHSSRPIAWQAPRTGLLCVAIIILAIAPTVRAASDDIPAWLKQAAAMNIPAYDKKVPAVVLVDEARLKVEDDGRVVTIHNYAVKIFNNEGRREAHAVLRYETVSEKVRDMRGWLIRPSGEVKKYAKDLVMSVAFDNDVYNESSTRVIIARDDAEPGSIFGFESVLESKQVFAQVEWEFQEYLPVLQSRCVLNMPPGWRAESITFNHSRLDPIIEGQTYTWELKDVPFLEEEPGSPAHSQLAPRLAVSYFPPASSRVSAVRTFADWAEVGRWLSELQDPQATSSDALAAKAQSLAAGARTEMDRIRSIGRYVQNVHYISIQTGIGRGGGYRPHAATEVFSKSYGDCKDKANLMRAMLKVIGIDSYLVGIFSGDPYFVRKEWASPQQFNHCIIAIKVKDETNAPTIITHPSLGRLLIFDPTDDDTPVGDLPHHEQGSYALVVAREAGAIMKMPVTPPDANRMEREIEAALGPNGTILASLKERATGQAAVSSRREFHHRGRPDYVKSIERWVSRGANGAKVSKVEPVDNPADDTFSLAVEFSADGYGQLMQGKLLVFKPALVSRREALALTGTSRKYPVVMAPSAFTESVRVKLPAGFDVDELPDPLKLDTPFGKYSATCTVNDGVLIFHRSLVTFGGTVPADQYSSVRSFFEKMRGAEQSPAVLVRK
jgi:hypothetical protein